MKSGGTQIKNLNCKEHPHYGELIYTSGGLLVCHICGKAFTKLGGHIWNKHRILTKDYCKMYGLDVGKGLCSEEHKKMLREYVIENYEKVVEENLVEGGRKTRFRYGDIGRPKEKISEQTRRRLVILGKETIRKTRSHLKRKNK